MKIGTRSIGPVYEPYVIAEIGVNHDGDASRAHALLDAAAAAGADAVKFQYFETDLLMSKAAKLAAYQKAAGETDPLAMLRRLELTLDDFAGLVDRAHKLGVHAIVSVFSVELVEPAATLPWDAFKTASPDVVNKPLLDALAATGRPMIVSTGTASAREVARAARWLESCTNLSFLHCVSAYPTPDAEAHLGAIAHVQELTQRMTGYSDHTTGEDTSMAAVCAGASLLEKHISDDPTRTGPDHASSLTPDALGRYIACAKRAHAMLGHSGKAPSERERDVAHVSRQSLVSTRHIEPGVVIEPADLTVKRPGVGIEPWRLDEVIGKRTVRAIEVDAPVMIGDVEDVV